MSGLHEGKVPQNMRPSRVSGLGATAQKGRKTRELHGERGIREGTDVSSWSYSAAQRESLSYRAPKGSDSLGSLWPRA